MQVIHRCCARQDTHKQTVVACVRVAQDREAVQHGQTTR